MSYNQTPLISPNELPGRKQNEAIIAALRGKLNNRGAVTLTANAASTTLTDEKIGPDSVILLSPMTANAAAAVGTTYFSTPGTGSATINHANNAQVDRTFRYVILG